MAGAPPPDDFRDNLLAATRHLRAFAIFLSGSVSAGDDLVQETLLLAWSKADQFGAGTNLRARLLSILRNIFYSNVRNRSREIEDGEGIDAQSIALPGVKESHIDLLDFRRALVRLPDHQREVLLLIDASGHSCEEAAAICQVEIGTVKSRLNRARLKLTKLLAL
jgi:RNA polymerase sigma-70 factor (ECF subfamily)